MASKSNIATKACKKAEADLATWLVMAKLGSFDELPPTAREAKGRHLDRKLRKPTPDGNVVNCKGNPNLSLVRRRRVIRTAHQPKNPCRRC